MSERPLLTVGGLIVASDGEILLVQSAKWHNLYSLPGGKVEIGETREEAFKREIWEETRLKIKNLHFAIVQESIFSEEFWQKKHFVMNDFIAELDPSCSKEDVKLNDEAFAFVWISPKQALGLPLHHACRVLIEWYLDHPRKVLGTSFGILGIHQQKISCKIGVYPEEQKQEQILIIDTKIKVDLSRCLASGLLQDTGNYAIIADICTELTRQNQYYLIETLASDILEECLRRLPAVWAWVCIQKPSAIPGAAYAFVELERYRTQRT